jgi:RNA polymerase II-associated factor 1
VRPFREIRDLANPIETAIQAAIHAPTPHPHDRALLRPLNSIGKPKVIDSGSSFLRRTEYISNAPKGRLDDHTPPKSTVKRARAADRFQPLPKDLDKESPEYILAAVQRSFEIAAANIANPLRIRHPTKRNVKLVSSHPMIPDLDAFNDAGGYISIKFQNNPVPPSNTYDTRLESGMLRPFVSSETAVAAHEKAVAAHERDPSRHPHPGPKQDYEFFLPETTADAVKFKRKVDVRDLESKDDDDLYTFTNQSGEKCFRFKRIRAYETSEETQIQGADRWNSEVVIAVNDGADGVHQRAAYVYPLVMRTKIRPQRSKNIDRQRFGDEAEEEDMVDFLDVMVREPDEGEIKARQRWAEFPNGDGEEEEEVVVQEVKAANGNGNGSASQNEHVEDDDAEAESE